jgi:class 3 adenylate cyclase
MSWRGDSLRTRLTRSLVALGFVSVILLASVNFFVVRNLLDQSARSQLQTLRDLRADSIELAIDRLLTRVSVFGTDPGVALALGDLESAYRTIDVPLDDDQLADLRATYAPIVEPYDEAGVARPDIAELVPAGVAGRHVQYHYITANPGPDRSDLEVSDDDATSYGAAHAEHHGFLRDLAASIGASDLMLVGLETGDVVYSVGKRVDLGTNVVDGPHAATGLGSVIDELGRASVDEAVIADSSFYLPDSSAPVVHVAAEVRNDSEVVGALVVTLRTERLTDIVTASQQWELLGLGDTGEAYVVGTDRRLRTVPRPWFEDPEGYIDRFRETTGDERAVDLIELTGSPVLLQAVDNDAVRTAQAGEQFVGRVDNYLDRATLAASRPLDVAGLGWVVVTEQQTTETRAELVRFVITIAILLVALLTVLAIVGILLARALARPVGPLVEVAERIANGDYRSTVPDLGRNELGDVGRQLDAVASRLREQDAAIAAEEGRITDMLASVLPAALAERVRYGEGELTEEIDTATVIAVAIRGIPAPEGAEQDDVVELTTRIAEATGRLIERHGVERLQVALEQQLFVAGRGRPGTDADAAASFAAALIEVIASIGAENGLEISARAGLSSGPVAAGILGSRQMSYGVWGAPVVEAVELSNVAAAGQLLADDSVVREVGDRWIVTAHDASGAHVIAAGVASGS